MNKMYRFTQSEERLKHVFENRLRKAASLLTERRRRGQDVRLLDCLQFSDKGQVLLKNKDIREQLEIPSRREGRARIKTLESLRNNLAHSQDIRKQLRLSARAKSKSWRKFW